MFTNIHSYIVTWNRQFRSHFTDLNLDYRIYDNNFQWKIWTQYGYMVNNSRAHNKMVLNPVLFFQNLDPQIQRQELENNIFSINIIYNFTPDWILKVNLTNKNFKTLRGNFFFVN